MLDPVAFTNHQLGAWEKICPVCQKRFFPAPQHSYVNKGKKLCSYTCYKRSQSMQSFQNPFAKKVGQFTRDGVLVKTFPSAADAAREHNVSQNHLRCCCRGEKPHVGGFVFKYIDWGEGDKK